MTDKRIIDERLGNNPLHRMRNRIAAEILLDDWTANYKVNKDSLKHGVSFDDFEGGNLAVIVGAGPTLEENLKDIKHVDKATFFCTDKAFPRICAKRIPEYVCALNTRSPNEECSKWWAAGDTTKSTLIIPITSDPLHLKHWHGKMCFINADLPVTLTDTITKETGLDPLPSGSNVGVFAYMMAVRMGFKNAALIGMDYSFLTREELLKRYNPKETYIIMEHRDKLGNIRWSDWGWFDSAIAFFENARYFGRNRGVRTVNSTERGIIYDGEFIEEMTLEEAGREFI